MSGLPKPAGPQSGAVILIPKQLRAEWMDVMALDARLSHVAFRAAGVIGSHFNNKTGQTFLSFELIAEKMGVSERTAWSAVKELERSGYLIVKRREFGTILRKTTTGREIEVRVAGGKGVANTYFPAFERSQVAATNTGLKLATRCELMWEQRSQNPASKVATGCEPTLTSPSEKNSSRAREPSGADALGPLAAIIRASIGDNEFRAWFGNSSISAETSDALTIALPTKFRRQEVIKRYEHRFPSWCQLVGKQRIETTVQAPTKGARQ